MNAPRHEYILVLTTCPDQDCAEDLAEALIIRNLAACVNILPGMASVYRWKGNIEHGSELLLIIKTRQQDYAQVEQTILELHPYELPECITVSIQGGLSDYLNWISESLDTTP